MYLQDVSQTFVFYSSEVLILSTDKAESVPVLTNAAGREDKDFNFEIDKEAEVFYSCSLTWQNELYVFGGRPKKTQISKVQSCQLEPIVNWRSKTYLATVSMWQASKSSSASTVRVPTSRSVE